MGELDPGIHEVVVAEALRGRLDPLGLQTWNNRPLHTADAADRIALHLSHEIERCLSAVSDSDGVQGVRDLIARLAGVVRGAEVSATPVEPGEVLHAILHGRPDGSPKPISEPFIPLLDSTLPASAPGEPGRPNQIGAEIGSTDPIDVLVVFNRRTGMFHRQCELGRPRQVRTTICNGSTGWAAPDQLAVLFAEVRISCDASTTRLRAKAWVFHRRSRFSTEYVGSSSVSRSAQVTGLKSNIRAPSSCNNGTLTKFASLFESRRQSACSVPSDRHRFAASRDELPHDHLDAARLAYG